MVPQLYLGNHLVYFKLPLLKSNKMRVKFSKGQQREFFKKVMETINCPSLRELINRGIDVNYSTLKNYYNEERLIPEYLFKELIGISGINISDFKFELIEENWGKVKGGKISRREFLFSIFIRELMVNGPTRNRTWILSTSRTCLSHWTMGPLYAFL